MSSFYSVVLCLVVFVASSFAVTSEEIAKLREVLAPVVTECGKQFDLSIDEIKAAKEAGTVEQLDPCFLACVFKKSGMLTDKGTFDANVASEKIKKYLSDPADLEKLNKVHNACSSVNDQEVSDGDKGCERSKILVSCLIKNKGDWSPITA